MKILSLDAKPWTLPLRAPFKIATRVATEAKNVLITLKTEGQTGYGGAAPVGYVTGESIDSVLSSIRSAAPELLGLDLSTTSPNLEAIFAALPDAPSARAGVEMAVLDAWGKTRGVSNWTWFGGKLDRLETDLTIPLVAPDEAAALVRNAAADGFTHFKIKVGSADGPEADVARIRAIVAAAPNAGLRIDANQAFDPESAVRFVDRVLGVAPHVELVEQPVAKEDIAGLKFVRDRVAPPIFADEAAQDPESVRRLIEADAVDGVNIKLMKSGIAGALTVIELCREASLRLMIGCMLESRLGLTAALHLAAGTGAIEFIDLDSHLLLAPDPGRWGGFIEDGAQMILDASKPGWGVSGLGEEGTFDNGRQSNR